MIRLVSEEKITETIERPQAICVVSNMPTAVAADHDAKSTAKK
jgi:hypothetical protein